MGEVVHKQMHVSAKNCVNKYKRAFLRYSEIKNKNQRNYFDC